jgi:tetratricopeptide (TPR) repeat protein
MFEESTGVPLAIADPADPVEQEFQKLLAADDAAQEEVDKWIRENQAFVAHGGGLPNEELNRRIEERFAKVKQSYENFLGRHPDHARGYIAYGSFLNDTKDEESAARQWEKALKLDPKNPATWNNLANYYGHRSPVKKAFEYYAKAIELNPYEPVYYHNFGTTVYLFRTDAMEYFKITEQEVFDKALDLYSKAQKLAPDNFPLATDIAQTYYGIRPMRTDAALQAWTNALNIARDEIEREGIYIHLARIKMNAGNFTDARAHLDAVTNGMYGDLKKRVLRNLDVKEKGLPTTNSASEPVDTNIWRMESTPTLRQ